MTSHPLPTKPHPIAAAFFEAHDDELEGSTSGKCGKSVAEIRNSVGWRTRYASSELYPLSILPVLGRRKFDRDDENESESFHVRQVFPRQSNDISTRDAWKDDDCAASNVTNKSPDEDDCEFGTGATVWPGSIVLLKYLEKLAHDPRVENTLKDKTVADLGSGTGITTVASALLGAKLVVCTDGCDPVVDLARQNIHDAITMLGPCSGGIDSTLPCAKPTLDDGGHCVLRGCKMIAQKYRWGEGMQLEGAPHHMGNCDNTMCNNKGNHHESKVEDTQRNDSQHFDIILGADCIVPKLYPLEPLVDAIDELSGNETITFLSYEQRHYQQFDPAKEFRRLATMRNLHVEVIRNHDLHPMYPANDIQIWKVTRDNTLCPSVVDDKARNRMHTIRSPYGGNRSNHKSLLVGRNE